MTTLEFLFGVHLGLLVMCHTDNLSKRLQQERLSAAQGQRLDKLTLSVLQKMRADDQFSDFYQRVVQEPVQFGFADPVLPRKRRVPEPFEVGSSTGHFHSTPEARYRQVYYEAIDHAIEAIHNCFDQPGYSTYKHLEERVLKACKGEVYESELEYVCSFYTGDLSKDQLETQLPLLQHLCRSAPSEITISDVIRTLSGLQSAERVAISAVWRVMKLLVVMLETNASSESSFSALWRIKTYLRTTVPRTPEQSYAATRECRKY